MYRHRRKFGMGGPRRNLDAAIWLIGLGFLAFTGDWWPGILILVGISLLAKGMFAQSWPRPFDDSEQTQAPPPQPWAAPPPPRPAPEPFVPAPPDSEHPFERLPNTCPQCGGPVRKNDVKWIGAQSAACAYCGSSLPLKAKNVP